MNLAHLNCPPKGGTTNRPPRSLRGSANNASGDSNDFESHPPYFNKAWYDGSIRGLDAEIARLYERLRKLGLSEDTLLILTSDHGEEFLEHGRMFHGQSVYSELNQVPLFFRLPGAVPAGVVVNQTVQTIDIMPTILEICRLAAPGKISGPSLTARMSAQNHKVSRSVDGSSVAYASAANEAPPAFTEKLPTTGSGGPVPKETGSVAVI